MKRIFFILSLFVALLVSLPFGAGNPVYADDPTAGSNKMNSTPPFGDQMVVHVNSDFGYRPPEATDGLGSTWHQGLDLDVPRVFAPCEGEITYAGSYGSGGLGVEFHPALQPDGPCTSDCVIVFMDLNVIKVGVGPIHKGEEIGECTEAIGGSTGGHLHMELWPNGYLKSGDPHADIANGACIDPGYYLTQAFGITLENWHPSGNRSGSDSAFSVSFEKFMKNIGLFFSNLMKFFMDACNKAYKYLFPLVWWLVGFFCLFDLVFPILLGGMQAAPFVLIIKSLKYAGLMGFVLVYPKFISDIILSFVTSISGAAVDPANQVMQAVPAPQLFLQHLTSLIVPSMNLVSNLSWFAMITNMLDVMIIWFGTLLVMGFGLLFAIYVIFAFVEFYVYAAMAFASVPFAALGLTKFVAEGMLGAIISSAIKILLASIMMFFVTTAIDNMSAPDISGAAVSSVTGGRISMASNEDYAGIPANAPTTPDKDKLDELLSDPVKARLYNTIMKYAPTAGVNEQVVFAIVGQESAFGTAPKIGNNVMQVDPGNDVSVANLSPTYKAKAEELGFHDRITIRDLFPDYDTDYDSNVQAGLVILHEKIMIDGGNVYQGVKDYNGGGDPQYMEHVIQRYYEYFGARLVFRDGPSGGTLTLSTDDIHLYWMMCAFIIFLCVVAFKVCADVARVWSGAYQLR